MFQAVDKSFFFTCCFLVCIWKWEQEYQYEEYEVDDSTSEEQMVVGSKSCSCCSYGCTEYEWKPVSYTHLLQRWIIEFRVARGENVFDPAHPERNTPESFIQANAESHNEPALESGIDNRINTIKNSNEEEH